MNADPERRTVRAGTYGKYISAKVYRSACHTLRDEIIFYPICNITFGDKAKVDSGIGIGKAYLIPFDNDPFIADM